MNRTNSQRARGRYYARYFAHYAKKNYALLVLGAFFLTGVALGAAFIRYADSDTIGLLMRVVDGFIENRREQSITRNFISSVTSSLTFICALFICGFCAVSQPVTLFAPLFRGLGFGFSTASLYANYGAGATGFIALLVLPDMLFSSVAILLCCRESLRLSGSFWGAMWNRDGQEGFYPLRIYLGRYVASAVLCIFSAFLQAVLYFAFAKYFILG